MVAVGELLAVANVGSESVGRREAPPVSVRQQRRQTGAALVLLCSGRLGAFSTRLYLVYLQLFSA